MKGVISVSEITNSIKLLLENNIGLISVEGEISNYKPHQSGHHYFTLKDDKAQINCTMWKTRQLNFKLLDGIKVIVTGTINVYPPRGNYQIDVVHMDVAGIGDLYQQFEMLKINLQKKGYFDAEHKQQLPIMPLHIGVSTSPTGSAVQDIFSTIKRRLPIAQIYFRPTRVQGEAAVQDIVNAIDELAKTPSQVIIIGRGGGSIEDLWAYNTEAVADAIYNCHIPIISGVGHETDFTISDFVADIRAETPTAAAVFATHISTTDLQTQFDDWQNSMLQSILLKIKDTNSVFNRFMNKSILNNIIGKIHYNYQFLDGQLDIIHRQIKHNFNNKKHLIEYLKSKCNELNPIAPLDKGFAMLKHNDKIINNESSISNFSKIEIIRKNEKAIVKFEKLLNDELFK